MKTPFRLLITGALGQTGTELVRRGREAGYEIAAFAREDLDISDGGAVARAIADTAPAAVINAAAYTAVDRAESEPEAAWAVNSLAPGFIARACHEAGIPMLHISTDYVFDGMGSMPYLEDAPISPQGVYGSTKAAGEEAVRRATPHHIILRTSWVFSAHGHNFVKTMLRLAGERDELNVVDDQRGCPTGAGDIADALLTIAGLALKTPGDQAFPWGTYHFSNRGETSWCGFARAIVEGSATRGGRKVEVRGIATADYPTPARRPAYSVLDCGKIQRTFGIIPRAWEDALAETLDPLTNPAHRTEGRSK